MKTTIFFLFLSIVAVTSCSLLGSGDEENLPDIPGKIVFAAEDDEGTSQIFTMDGNGSNVEQLTDFGPEGEAVQPSWSPNGERIIFSSFKGGTSNGPALWVMDADGTDQQFLYNPDSFPLEGYNARWSPDGTEVLFDLCVNCQTRTNYEIYLFDTNTKMLSRLTDHPASDTNPSWSPNGSRIVFVSDRDYVDADTLRFRKDLYLLNIKTMNLERLTKTGYTREPVWKPVGNSIVFRSTSSSSGLYKIDIMSRDIKKFKDDLDNRTHLHPNAWGSNGNLLLITSRLLDPPNTNTLFVFGSDKNDLINIYSKASNNNNQLISGADLHLPVNN